jgi:uncharacterized protein (TIGR02099 family)
VSDPAPTFTSRWLKRLWRWTAVLFAASVLLAATAVGLFRVLVPMAPDYLREVEALVGSTLGVRVTVSRMDLRWRLAGPALLLEGVAFDDLGDGRRLAVAGEVDVGLDALVAIRDRELVPGWIRVRGLEVALGRDLAGGLLLAGGPLPTPPQRGPDGGLPEAFEFELEAATITWHEPSARDPEFIVRGLRAHVTTGADGLQFTAQVPLPGTLEDPIQIRGTWRGPRADAGGEGLGVTVVGQGLDLASIGAWLPAGIAALDGGTGDLWLRAEVDTDGRLRLLAAEVDLEDVGVSIGRGQLDHRVGFDELSGRFEWQQVPGGWRVETESLHLLHGSRVHEPVDLVIDQVDDPIRGRRQIALSANSLPADELALAAWFTDEDVAERLHEFAPVGELQSVRLSVDLSAAEPEVTEFSGGFVDLGWSPVGQVPGIEGLDGEFRLTGDGGLLALDASEVRFDAPELFRTSLRMQRVAAQVSILRDHDAVTVRADEIDLINDHGHVTGRGSIAIIDPEAGPYLDFDLRLEDGDLSAKSDYLPVGIMPEPVVAWLDRGVVSGRVPRAEILLRGPARSYPYRDGSGIFLIRFDYEDAVLDFAEGWPVATRLAGETVFEGPGLTVTAQRGGWEGIEITHSLAVIPDLPLGQLAVEAVAAPDLSAVLGFVRDSPLSQRFGAYLNAASGDGPTEVAMTLNLPLGQVDDLTLEGDIRLDQAALALSEGRIPLQQADGVVEFTRDAIMAQGISASLWGNPVTLDIQPDPAGGSKLLARGVMPLADLPEDLSSSPLVAHLDGALDWRLDASFPADPREDAAPRQLVLRSDLVGLVMDLPTPFGKPALEARDTVLTIASPRPGMVETQMVQAGRVGITARWRFGDRWSMERAHVRLGGGLPAMPADVGIWVSGRTDRMDADAWWALADAADDTDSGPSLASLSLSLGELGVLGQRYADTRLNLDRTDEGWLLRLDGADVSGSVRVPQRSPDGAPMIADFERLRLMSGESDATPDPRTLQGLRLSAQEVSIDGAALGSVTLVLDRIPAGFGLSEFRISAPEHELTGTGGWIVDDGADYSQFSFVLDSTDVADTLQRFGFAEGLSGDSGHLEAQLSWRGALFRPSLGLLDGEAQIQVFDGQVNEVSPGAGRLFGLLSINALQRRLLLDFSDLFGRGLAFDTITATYHLDQGDAYTDDLLLRGPGLDVGIAGRTGLAARDYDQQVLVNAKLGNALPLAGALAAGPAVGAALLVFSRLFRDELRQSTQVQYRVTGPWDEPVVERVDVDTPPPVEGDS